MNTSLLKQIDHATSYTTKGYNKCMSLFEKTKDELFNKQAEYWLNERDIIIHSLSLTLTDEEYLTLEIY